MRFFTLLICLNLSIACLAASRPGIRDFDPKTGVTFELVEHTQLESYWWPSTLLSYPVQFPEGQVRAESLQLTDLESSRILPFQLSSVKKSGEFLRFAIVHFLADLPSGGRRRFRLEMATRPTGTTPSNSVTESLDGNYVVLSNERFQIRVPRSQQIGGTVPGPIAAVARGSEWMGGGGIVSPKRKITGIETSRLESGPLFVRYSVVYHLEGDARYTADIRVIHGYDHVELRESMEGLLPEDGVYWDASWRNFHPTHRHAPNHPYLSSARDQAITEFDKIPWERIDEAFINTQHGVSSGISREGELPFRLGIYQPWGAYIILSSSCFWDERSNQTLGVFIDRTEDWRDQEYAIWAASNTLQVRYFYRDGVLSWRWPLTNGQRATGIAVYDHSRDREAVQRIAALTQSKAGADGVRATTKMFPASHTQFLQNRYGMLHLDLVKDWVLDYGTGPRNPGKVFPEGTYNSPEQLLKTVLQGELAAGMTTSGTRQNSGFAPVPARLMYETYVDGLHRNWNQLSDAQKERISAWYLMLAYVAAGEDWMPMQTMLAGHPNFLSDVKTVPALVAALFPEHPMAREWADLFEKFIELNTRYHTRPAVQAWNSRGGRWTENLGTYVWAFLRPLIRAEYMLREHFDGKNRLASPRLAEIADWAVNALSAPYDGEDLEFYRDESGRIPNHFWGIVTKELGPRRLHPPQGAHSARRMPPRTLWWMGKSLLNYRPLLAEALMWASRQDDQDSEHPKDKPDPWKIMFTGPTNTGTNPHLRSSKYTGYGITLRAGVDTKAETSIHLVQLDEGPNYRWGIAGEGGCGVIYYYAGGKAYSHNGREDVGDRPAHDTDFATNFGVWKDGRFRSIGRNVLKSPLMDLGPTQFVELLPRTGNNAYSWPEYQSRSVMMAGTDYFAIYDDVFNDAVAHRFSWATHKNEDFPYIHLIKGGMRSRQKHLTQLSTAEVKAVWYDGQGDAFAIISHDPDLKTEPTPYGAVARLRGTEDHLFRDPDGIDFDGHGVAFTGTAGIIRRRSNGGYELSLFRGTRITAGRVTIRLEENSDVAFRMEFDQPEESRGNYYSKTGGTVTIECDACGSSGTFYIDGAPHPVSSFSGGMKVALPVGRHQWQYSRGLAIPLAPTVLGTENSAGASLVSWQSVSGAESYRVELSDDGSATWRRVGETISSSMKLSNLANGRKYHVRVVAMNRQHESAAGPEYPIYATADAPAHPDGLRVTIEGGRVSVSWGQVLGVSRYRLYRRKAGEQQFQVVYEGAAQEFHDALPGVVPAFERPGIAANILRDKTGYTVYHYAVASVNGNGEGKKSPEVSTDPTSWLHWDPRPGEPFRRRYTYNTSNYTKLGEEEDHSSYYPK
jgi:hypothetical protein